MNILLENVTLLPSAVAALDADDATETATWDIGIIEGYIAFIHAHRVPGQALKYGSEAFGAYRAWDRVIFGGERLALPGLVNAHTHLGMTLFRGYADDLSTREWLERRIWPIEAKLTGDDVFWASLLAIGEMLKGGVTTCGDMYFHMDDAARAVAESGIRASLARGVQDIGGSGHRGLVEAVRLCHDWHGSYQGRITTMLGPHAPYTCTPEFLRSVVERAERLDVPLHIHVAETKEEMETMAALHKQTPLGFLAQHGVLDLPLVAVHGVYFTREDISLAQARGVRMVHCPASNLKLANGIAPVPAMLTRGLTVGLGTDSAASNNTLDLWGEMRLAALLHKGAHGDAGVIPAATALAMATRGGAEALHLDNVGRISPGWAADLILVNTDGLHWLPALEPEAAIVYAGGRQDVSLAMVAGRVVYENGELLTIDEEQLHYQIARATRRLGLL